MRTISLLPLGLRRLLMLGAATGPVAHAGAQPAPQPRPAPAIDAAVRRDVVDTLAAQFTRYYVDADTGRIIADRLRRRLAAGAYDGLVDPQAFAEALTADLRAVNGDKHLSVGFAPGEPAMRPGPNGIPTPGIPGVSPAGGALATGPGPQSPPPQVVAQARRANYGFGRVDILPGNVGYVEVRGFMGGPEAFDVAVNALRHVQHADAVIFDLRRMPGGSGGLSNFVISHFTGPDTVRALRITNRSTGEAVDRWTLATVPGPRRPEVPLYVLTSRGTVSAGEDFAFVLQSLGRATVVGERTAGAGHNNAFIGSGHGFVTSISFTRVSDPRTGKEWERVGVRPDVETPPAEALAAAHAHALGALAGRAEDPVRRRALDLTRELVEAQRRPRAVAASTLARHVGEYEGGRAVSLDGTRLLFRPGPDYPPDELVPVADDAFAPTPTARVRFERAADGTAVLRMTFPDGGSRTFRRVR